MSDFAEASMAHDEDATASGLRKRQKLSVRGQTSTGHQRSAAEEWSRFREGFRSSSHERMEGGEEKKTPKTITVREVEKRRLGAKS